MFEAINNFFADPLVSFVLEVSVIITAFVALFENMKLRRKIQELEARPTTVIIMDSDD